jgi:hypothetical protein
MLNLATHYQEKIKPSVSITSCNSFLKSDPQLSKSVARISYTDMSLNVNKDLFPECFLKRIHHLKVKLDVPWLILYGLLKTLSLTHSVFSWVLLVHLIGV